MPLITCLKRGWTGQIWGCSVNMYPNNWYHFTQSSSATQCVISLTSEYNWDTYLHHFYWKMLNRSNHISPTLYVFLGGGIQSLSIPVLGNTIIIYSCARELILACGSGFWIPTSLYVSTLSPQSDVHVWGVRVLRVLRVLVSCVRSYRRRRPRLYPGGPPGRPVSQRW